MNGSLTSFSLITAARLLQNKALFGDPGIQEANLHTLLKLVNGIMMREASQRAFFQESSNQRNCQKTMRFVD